MLVLTRDRNQSDGLLQVTGRDVSENAYALIFNAGIWSLDGGSLEAAAKAAAMRRAEIGLGDRSKDTIEAVSSHDRPITPAQVAKRVGVDNDTAGKYLRRMADTGRLRRTGRGLYTPPSEVSDVRKTARRFGHRTLRTYPLGDTIMRHET